MKLRSLQVILFGRRHVFPIIFGNAHKRSMANFTEKLRRSAAFTRERRFQSAEGGKQSIMAAQKRGWRA